MCCGGVWCFALCGLLFWVVVRRLNFLVFGCCFVDSLFWVLVLCVLCLVLLVVCFVCLGLLDLNFVCDFLCLFLLIVLGTCLLCAVVGICCFCLFAFCVDACVCFGRLVVWYLVGGLLCFYLLGFGFC